MRMTHNHGRLHIFTGPDRRRNRSAVPISVSPGNIRRRRIGRIAARVVPIPGVIPVAGVIPTAGVIPVTAVVPVPNRPIAFLLGRLIGPDPGNFRIDRAAVPIEAGLHLAAVHPGGDAAE